MFFLYIIYIFMIMLLESSTQLYFTLKDVIMLLGGFSTIATAFFALKKSVEKLSVRMEAHEQEDEKNYKNLQDALKNLRIELMEKERTINERIDKIQTEQKAANEKLEGKIDTISKQVSEILINISSLTGFLRGKNISD